MSDDKRVYWHRELPPLAAEPMGEDEIEALGPRLPREIARDRLWTRSTDALRATAEARIAQEIERLGGTCAHVNDDHIEEHTDHASGESWLRGRFAFVVYR